MDIRFTRRSILASLTVGSLTLAGCGAFSSDPDGVVLSHIRFFNRTTDERTIRFQVTSRDDTIVDDTVTVEGHRENADTHSGDTERFVDENLHDPRPYTIRYRLESDGEWDQSYSFDGSEYTCLGLAVFVRDAGMSLYTGEVPEEECPGATTPTE